MSKVFQGMMAGLKRYSLSIGVLSLALIIAGTHFATAQQGSSNGNSLGNHHSELTVNVEAGEFAYVPIPKVNFPVRVGISMRKRDSNSENFSYGQGSFTISNFEGNNVIMSYPENITQNGRYQVLATCDDASLMGVKEAFTYILYPSVNPSIQCLNDYEHNPSAVAQDLMVFGLANYEEGLGNRIFVGHTDPAIDPETGNPRTDEVTFYIQMWY